MGVSGKEIAPSVYNASVLALLGALTFSLMLFTPGLISDGTGDSSMLYFMVITSEDPVTWESESRITGTSSPAPEVVLNATFNEVQGHARFNIPNANVASGNDADLTRAHNARYDGLNFLNERFLAVAQSSLRFVTDELSSALYGSEAAYQRNVEIHKELVRHRQVEVDKARLVESHSLSMFHSMNGAVIFGLIATIFMLTAFGSLLSKHELPLQLPILLSAAAFCLVMSGVLFAVYHDLSVEVVRETTHYCAKGAREILRDQELARIRLDDTVKITPNGECRFRTRYYGKTVMTWIAVALAAIAAVCAEVYRRLERTHELAAAPAELREDIPDKHDPAGAFRDTPTSLAG